VGDGDPLADPFCSSKTFSADAVRGSEPGPPDDRFFLVVVRRDRSARTEIERPSGHASPPPEGTLLRQCLARSFRSRRRPARTRP